MPDISIVASQVANAPQDYKLPGAQEILLRAVGCNINGASAAGAFLPALQMLDPAGHVMWTAVNRSVPVAAGASALMSWFPGGGIDQATSSSSAAGITSIGSPNGTLSVTNPTGPATSLDIPASGVVAGTYGDATHTSQVTIASDGIVTAASQVSISGLAGTGLVKLFSSTLGAPAASIDTGASAIPTGHGTLIIYIVARGVGAGGANNVLVTVNGDTGSNYDSQVLTANNAAVSASVQTAAARWFPVIHDDGGTANYPGMTSITIPLYDKTTFFKAGVMQFGVVDATGGNNWSGHYGIGWRSTAAINQVTVTGNAENLKAGSTLTIYGTE